MHLGLIGKSLKHSFSKKYFTEKFEGLKLHGHSYTNFELESIEELPALLRENPQLAGLNVTIPYKTQVIPYLALLSEEAEKTGAVNTLKIFDGKLHGFNTDVHGFGESLKPQLKATDSRVLILGTGGASKAVERALLPLNLEYEKVSRHPMGNEWSYSRASAGLENFQVVVNTTPLGTYPEIGQMPPLALDKVSENHLIYDLVYNPVKTRLLAEAEKRGARIKNGYEMLALQAERAWEIWNEL